MPLGCNFVGWDLVFFLAVVFCIVLHFFFFYVCIPTTPGFRTVLGTKQDFKK